MTDQVMRRLLMSKEDIERTIHRMAYEVWEKNASKNVALVGIRSRGVPLAQRIQRVLHNISGEENPLGILDIGLYRDDLGMNHFTPEVRSTDIPFDVEGRDIVLVDDVLYTGRTIRAALNALSDLGRPNRVQLLVMIDRGHRELPIQADFIGKSVKTYDNEKVNVLLNEIDEQDGVFIDRVCD